MNKAVTNCAVCNATHTMCRRNPDHFKQFSHPGDSDEEENPDGRELTGRDR